MLMRIFLFCTLAIASSNSVYADISAVTASGASESNSTSPSYYADKWYRDSSERDAIYREIYFMAENVIRTKIASEHLKPHQWGVVLDIDETVLDNSQWDYNHDIQKSAQSWNDFAAESISIPAPGAKKFINDIHAMGGYVNLVSNRPISLMAKTIKNLRSQNIYFDQILLDQSNVGTSFVDKNPRFIAIIDGKSPSELPPQKIVAYFGDNIQDFPGLLQAKMIQKNSDSDAYNQFGNIYFLLPNPMYGSWEQNAFH